MTTGKGSFVSVIPIASEKTETDPIKMVFTQLLKDLTACKSLVEVNIAAGIALECLQKAL